MKTFIYGEFNNIILYTCVSYRKSIDFIKYKGVYEETNCFVCIEHITNRIC